MRLIIKKENFDTDNIKFKNNKTGIKLMYDVNNVYMIGIPLALKFSDKVKSITFFEKVIIMDPINIFKFDIE